MNPNPASSVVASDYIELNGPAGALSRVGVFYTQPLAKLYGSLKNGYAKIVTTKAQFDCLHDVARTPLNVQVETSGTEVIDFDFNVL